MALVLLSVWPREIKRNTSLDEFALAGRKHSLILKVKSILGRARQYGHITSSMDAAYNQEVCIVHIAINHVKVC